jgi:hypothetical protein
LLRSLERVKEMFDCDSTRLRRSSSLVVLFSVLISLTYISIPNSPTQLSSVSVHRCLPLPYRLGT